MKEIIIYDNTTGKLINTIDISQVNYSYLESDIPSDKQVTKVNLETKEVVLDDSDEIKANKKKTQDELDKKQFDIQAKQLALDKANYELLKQQSSIIDTSYIALEG